MLGVGFPVRAARPPAAALWPLPGRPRPAVLLLRAPGWRAHGRAAGVAPRAHARVPILPLIPIGSRRAWPRTLMGG
eukprot:12377394-Alexandrium_andersonii.AAC.1